MSNRKQNYRYSQRARKLAIKKLLSLDVKTINGRRVKLCKNEELFQTVIKKTGNSIHFFIDQIDRKREEKGQIYVIGNLNFGLIKIGFSKNPERRKKGIQTGCPFEVSVLVTFEGDKKTEKMLHHKYRKYNTSGEWFKYEGELKEHLSIHLT